MSKKKKSKDSIFFEAPNAKLLYRKLHVTFEMNDGLEEFEGRVLRLEKLHEGSLPVIPAEVAALMSEVELLLYRLIQLHPNGLGQQDVMVQIPKALEQEVLLATNRMLNRFIEVRENQEKVFFLLAVPVEEILQTRSLSSGERTVYWAIRGYGNKGVWLKELKSQVLLVTKAIDDAIKKLEKLELVKSVKPIRTPIRKLYMLARFTPAEEIVGGVFYSAADLDKEFITTLSTIVLKYIQQKFQAKSLTEGGDFTYAVAAPDAPDMYPTVAQITKYVNSAKILRVELQQSDVQVILDRLVFLGLVLRFERTASDLLAAKDDLDRYAYRPLPSDGFSARVTLPQKPVSLVAVELALQQPLSETSTLESFVRMEDIESLHQIPCMTCPVFDLCGDTGKVTPQSCEYFNKWLNPEVGKILNESHS